MLSTENMQLYLFHEGRRRYQFSLNLVLSGIANGGKYPALVLNNFGLGDQQVNILLDTIISNLSTIGLMNLQLKGNQLTDVIVGKIITFLQDSRCLVRYLDLSGNNITKTGIERIKAEISGLPFSIQSRELESGTGITGLQYAPTTGKRLIL